MIAPLFVSPTRVREPGLNALPANTERYVVKGGGSVALTLGAGDELELVNPEGLQPGEICAFDANGRSDGGLLVAAAEMAMAGELGLDLEELADPAVVPADNGAARSLESVCFAEEPSRYLLEIETKHLPDVRKILHGLPYGIIGRFTDTGRVRMSDHLDVGVTELLETWRAPLDW